MLVNKNGRLLKSVLLGSGEMVPADTVVLVYTYDAQLDECTVRIGEHVYCIDAAILALV